MKRPEPLLPRLLEFLSSRLPLEKMSFQSLIQKKEVPVHRWGWVYYLGGLTLFFFAVQMLTGLMLLFYYEPTVSDAFTSVEFITRYVNAGGLIRNLHSWSSSAMILCLLLHLLTTFATKAFEKPRELTWIAGVLLLFITLGFGFTGYLLPWHQVAVNATKVALQSIEEMGRYLPGAFSSWPSLIKEIIQGGPDVGQATLSRFYALHVVILPLSLLAVLGLHLLSVQLHGMSQGIDHPSRRTERFFPLFILKDFSLWGIAFLGLFVLALCLPFEAFFPYPLFAAYDALGSTPEGIKPEWYFLPVYYPLELLPFWVVVVGLTVGKIGLFLVPWIFSGTRRRTLQILALGAAFYLFVSTVFGQQLYVFFKGGGV